MSNGKIAIRSPLETFLAKDGGGASDTCSPAASQAKSGGLLAAVRKDQAQRQSLTSHRQQQHETSSSLGVGRFVAHVSYELSAEMTKAEMASERARSKSLLNRTQHKTNTRHTEAKDKGYSRAAATRTPHELLQVHSQERMRHIVTNAVSGTGTLASLPVTLLQKDYEEKASEMATRKGGDGDDDLKPTCMNTCLVDRLRRLEQPLPGSRLEAEFAGKAFAALSAAAVVLDDSGAGIGNGSESSHKEGGRASSALGRGQGNRNASATSQRISSAGSLRLVSSPMMRLVGMKKESCARLPGPDRLYARAQRSDVLAAVVAQSAVQLGVVRPASSSGATSDGHHHQQGLYSVERLRGSSSGLGDKSLLLLTNSGTSNTVEQLLESVSYRRGEPRGRPSADQPTTPVNQSTTNTQPTTPQGARYERSQSLPSYWADGYLLNESNYTRKFTQKTAPMSIIESRRRRRQEAVPVEVLRCERRVFSALRNQYESFVAPLERRSRDLPSHGGLYAHDTLISEFEEPQRPSSSLLSNHDSLLPYDDRQRMVLNVDEDTLQQRSVPPTPSPEQSIQRHHKSSPLSSPRKVKTLTDDLPMDPTLPVLRDSDGLLIPNKLLSGEARANRERVGGGEGGRRKASIPHTLFSSNINHHSQLQKAVLEDNGNAVESETACPLEGAVGQEEDSLCVTPPPSRSCEEGLGGRSRPATRTEREGSVSISPPRPATRLGDLRYTSKVEEEVRTTEQWTPFREKRDAVQSLRQERKSQVQQRREHDAFICELQHTAIRRSTSFWKQHPSPAMAMKKFDRMVVLSRVAKSSDGTAFLGGGGGTSPSYLSRKEATLHCNGNGKRATTSNPVHVVDDRGRGGDSPAPMERYADYHAKITGRQSFSASLNIAGSESQRDGALPPPHLRKENRSKLSNRSSSATKTETVDFSPAPFSIRGSVISVVAGTQATPTAAAATKRDMSPPRRGLARDSEGGESQHSNKSLSTREDLFIGNRSASAQPEDSIGKTNTYTHSHRLSNLVKKEREALKDRIRHSQSLQHQEQPHGSTRPRATSPTFTADKAYEGDDVTAAIIRVGGGGGGGGGSSLTPPSMSLLKKAKGANEEPSKV